jgi:hypothetical protein
VRETRQGGHVDDFQIFEKQDNDYFCFFHSLHCLLGVAAFPIHLQCSILPALLEGFSNPALRDVELVEEGNLVSVTRVPWFTEGEIMLLLI